MKIENTLFRNTGELPVRIFILITVLGVYLWSMPGTVVLEDDGLFLLAAYYNGIAHPPGYPLYTLLSHIATWLPFGSVAQRVHGFTALVGAVGCICLYQVIRQLQLHVYVAVLAALAFGFSLAYWSQSIIAEVYNLNVVIVLLLYHSSLLYAADADPASRQMRLNRMGLYFGLGLANHWPLLVLSTPLFLMVLLPHWRTLLRQFPQGILFGLAGLTPYIWMVWRSQMDPFISFYGPIESWQEFWSFISREMYAGVEHSPTAGWIDKLQFSGFVAGETVRQFTLTGFVFVAIGFVSQWKYWRWPVTTGLVLGYLGNTLLLIGLLGMDYDYFNQSNFRVCPLVAYAVCAIWMALGLQRTLLWLHAFSHLLRPKVLQALAACLVVFPPLLSNAADNYRATDSWAEDYSRIVLDTLEPDAILFTNGDVDVWTTGYVRYVLGHREDVTLYNIKGSVFSNRLFKPYTLPYDEAQQRLADFVRTTGRPVYYTYGFPRDFGETDYGLITRLDRHTPPEQQRAVVLPHIRQYFEMLLATGEPMDNWEKLHHRILLAANCLQSTRLLHAASSGSDLHQQMDEWTRRVCINFQAKLQTIGYLLNVDADNSELPTLLDEAEQLKHQVIARSELSRLALYRSQIQGGASN